MDQFTDKAFNFTLGSDLVQTGLTSLVFTSGKLRTNTHYAGTLNANNVKGTALSSIQISKIIFNSYTLTYKLGQCLQIKTIISIYKLGQCCQIRKIIIRTNELN